MDDIFTDSGYQASFSTIIPRYLSDKFTATTEDGWEYQDSGYDNDNASEIFFTWNGNGTRYCLHQKGHRATGAMNSYMYIRFAPGGLISSDKKLKISSAKYEDTSAAGSKEPCKDGYVIAKNEFCGSASITIEQK